MHSEAPLLRGDDIARRAVALVSERLPADWTTEFSLDGRKKGRGIDLDLRLGPKGGQSGRLVAEVKPTVVPRELPWIANQLAQAMRSLDPPAAPMVVARYLTPASREWLTDQDMSYCDATGNMRISLGSPALFLCDKGATKDPWRSLGRPRHSLKGAPAARVVRALADFAPPYSVPELVALAGSSTGPTYRVVELLSELGLLTRTQRGPIDTVDWRGALEAWSKDYSLQETNWVGSYLHPRGLESMMTALRSMAEPPYAVTGSLAAALKAPYAPAKLAVLYTDQPEVLAERCGLRRVDRGANVLLVIPKYEIVMARREWVDNLAYAAPSQVAVDLLTGPGRAPSEGLALLDWMGDNLDAWRKQPDR